MKVLAVFIIFFTLLGFNGFGQNYLLDTSQNAYFVHGTVG